jgi:tetratricopeptide (TPR) repeat protein
LPESRHGKAHLLPTPCGDGRCTNGRSGICPLTTAYPALRAKDYDAAIQEFRKAAALAPDRPAVREDFAYTLLKVGDTEDARDQFAEALLLDTGNDQVALEYTFLCSETKQPIVARRILERLAKAGNATAQPVFENVDKPLRAAIERGSGGCLARRHAESLPRGSRPCFPTAIRICQNLSAPLLSVLPTVEISGEANPVIQNNVLILPRDQHLATLR